MLASQKHQRSRLIKWKFPQRFAFDFLMSRNLKNLTSCLNK